jgi:hypothetical protein
METPVEDFVRYLDEIVEPTIIDFEADPTSRRRAFLACVVTCHAVDYLSFPRDAQKKRQQFSGRSDAFKIIDNVGQSFKHVVAGKPAAPRFQARHLISRPPGKAGLALAGISRIGDAIGSVTLATDPTVDVLEVVKRAVVFLRKQIVEPPAP